MNITEFIKSHKELSELPFLAWQSGEEICRSFYCKNILKKFKKVGKNLLTNKKRCVIIVIQPRKEN